MPPKTTHEITADMLARAQTMATPIADVAYVPPSFVFGSVVPAGFPSIIGAPTKTGKSLIIESIIADASQGRATVFDIADGAQPGTLIRLPMTTLYLPGEDRIESEVKRNLVCAGADQAMIIVPTPESLAKLRVGSAELEALISLYRPSLLVIDPWSRFYDDSRYRMGDREGVIRFFDVVRDLIAKYRLEAVLLTANTNKDRREPSTGASELYGSQQLIDAARSVLMCCPTANPEDPDEICISQVGSNARERGSPTILLRKNRARGIVEYIGTSDLSYQVYRNRADSSYASSSSLTKAKQAIMERMGMAADADEQYPTREEAIVYAARVAACSRNTAINALSALARDGKIILPGSGRGHGNTPLRLPDAAPNN